MGWKGPQGDKLELKRHTHTHTRAAELLLEEGGKFWQLPQRQRRERGLAERDQQFPSQRNGAWNQTRLQCGKQKEEEFLKKQPKKKKKSVCSNLLVRVAHVVQNTNAQTR